METDLKFFSGSCCYIKQNTYCPHTWRRETIGAIDNVIRHSITKMSHIHFTSTNDYRNKVIQMGENPKYVFNIGALGLEDINKFNFKTKKYFEKKNTK